MLDEPDAHLHEKRKSEVYELICQNENSQIIVTSHSPKMIKLFPYDNQIILRKNESGKLEAVTTHEFDEFKDILDTDISFEEEFAIRESRMPLLLVEGKTDKNHISTAWSKLNPEQEMPFVIVPLSCAEKIRQYIISVPDKFAKSVLIGLVDNDKSGQEAKRGCETIGENIYKFINDQGQRRKGYCIVIPFVDDEVSLFNYCPIEFLYDVDVLLANDVLEKRDYHETISTWIRAGKDGMREAEYDSATNKCFYKVNDSVKNSFSKKVEELDPEKFANFRKIFEMINSVLMMQ